MIRYEAEHKVGTGGGRYGLEYEQKVLLLEFSFTLGKVSAGLLIKQGSETVRVCFAIFPLMPVIFAFIFMNVYVYSRFVYVVYILLTNPFPSSLFISICLPSAKNQTQLISVEIKQTIDQAAIRAEQNQPQVEQICVSYSKHVRMIIVQGMTFELSPVGIELTDYDYEADAYSTQPPRYVLNKRSKLNVDHL